MLAGEGREFLLVRAPAEFGRRRAFLAEAFDAPRVDELVHLLRLIADLRVALAAVDDLHTQLHGQLVEPQFVHQPLDLTGAGAIDFLVGDQLLADIQQALLDEVGDQSRVGPVLDARRWTRPRTISRASAGCSFAASTGCVPAESCWALRHKDPIPPPRC